MAPRDMALYVDDRPKDGVFRLHRDIYADPEIFELEQKFIFQRSWNFLAIESQIVKPNDYVTAHIGRTPVLLMRDAKGVLGAFVNVCRHKGAILCGAEQGNAKYHVCPYHGWTYDAAGKNVDIKDRKNAAYLPAFERENHDLLRLARLESYKGLIFGSLSPDVASLEDFLGDMRFFIDVSMEQGPHGMEFIPGRMAYTYRANWKLQLDNGLDPYHLTSTHQSFIGVQARRRRGEGNQEARGYDWAKRTNTQAGGFNFPHGHTVFWTDQPEAEKRPIYSQMAEIKRRVGDTRADWMLKVRQAHIFPNMQIAESAALMLRTFRPLAVDRTEMRSYCLAPIGESAERRAWRLRQFEDFFNPSGMATPDDTVVYEDCQIGFNAEGSPWLQGYERGMAAVTPGGNDISRSLGLTPSDSIIGTFETGLETCLHGVYREWRRLIEAGLAGTKAATR